ncbi:MAG TPA: glycosyltransferase [Terriglobia bacterium]|nr:glycosyltransferase [Terriglobia bacterium]
MVNRPSLMFYCQHLLGIGHLVRSVQIVGSLAKKFRVLLALGGAPVEEIAIPAGVQLLQLPPLESDLDFTSLDVCGATAALDDVRARRRDMLLRACDAVSPDILVTELFPFGRRQFGFELLPLLEHFRSRKPAGITVSSVRDVLVTKADQAKYERRVRDLVNRYYDLVLVHGDERLVKLDETFSRLGDLQCEVRYTGYVAPKECAAFAPDAESDGRGDPLIVVSNGGGRCESGSRLLESVIQAAMRLQRRLPHTFEIYTGPLVPADLYGRWSALARTSQNIRVATFTPHLAQRMKRANLSISMGGYNTVMDVLSAGVRALLYPVTANSDQEQAVRARKLQALGVVGILSEEDLAPRRMEAAIQGALATEPRGLVLNLEGAKGTLIALMDFLLRRQMEGSGAKGGAELYGASEVGAGCFLGGALCAPKDGRHRLPTSAFGF